MTSFKDYIVRARRSGEDISVGHPRSESLGHYDFDGSAERGERTDNAARLPGRRSISPTTAPPEIDDRRWVLDNLDSLTALHPDRWIAVLKGAVIDSDVSGTELRRRVELKFSGTDPVYWLVEGAEIVYGD